MYARPPCSFYVRCLHCNCTVHTQPVLSGPDEWGTFHSHDQFFPPFFLTPIPPLPES